MSEAIRMFSMQFREHTLTDQWEERKYIIAACIALCWDKEEWRTIDVGEPSGESDFERKSVDELNQIIDELGFCCYEDLGSTFFLSTDDGDDYTSTYSLEAMKEGMKLYFPDIDYELHWLDAIDGDVTVDVTIMDNSREYKGFYWMVYPQYQDVYKNDARYLRTYNLIAEDEETPKTREDVLKLKSFIIPEATEDNPHPFPKGVLVDEDEEEYPPSPKWFFLQEGK